MKIELLAHAPSRSPACLQAPAQEETARVFERSKDLGVLLGKGGLRGNVFRIKPPMCLTRADADFLLQVLDQALTEL